MERERGAAALLWGHGHLPLLAHARSKDSVEYILQALWRTRRTGLDAADRAVARDILQLSDDADLDPARRHLPSLLGPPTPPDEIVELLCLLQLLVCLRILIRRCVNEKVAKEDIPKLFPPEVPPELQKLLTLLLQKFQPEWQDDVSKEQASTPALHSDTADGQLNQNGDASNQPPPPPPATTTAELQNGTSHAEGSVESGEREVKKFPLARDSLDKMLKELFSVKDQISNVGNSNGHEERSRSG